MEKRQSLDISLYQKLISAGNHFLRKFTAILAQTYGTGKRQE